MICSLKYGEKIYKVNALVDEAGETHGYRVMKGRRIAKGGAWFDSERESILFMLRIAFMDVIQLSMQFAL